MQDSDEMIRELADEVIGGHVLTVEQGQWLLGLTGGQRYRLFHEACRIRHHFRGQAVSLCGIVSVRTGGCSEDCRFCAQSAEYSTGVGVEALSDDEVVARARLARSEGVSHFGLVASGYGPSDAEVDRLVVLAGRVKQEAGLACCGSVGCLSRSQARRLAEGGIVRYNHNLETSAEYFDQVVGSHGYEDRVATVRYAAEVGMGVCCGGIVGMGESPVDRVRLAAAIRALPVDSVPLNFLHPIEGTPMGPRSRLRPLEALQVVAMFRFMLPERGIRLAGGRESVLRDLRSWLFYAGADGMMIGNYLTTAGRSAQEDITMLEDLELSHDARAGQGGGFCGSVKTAGA